MAKDKKKAEPTKVATPSRQKGTPRPGRVERHERRMSKATMRRDLAIIEVRANDGSFKALRGKRRAAAVERADRCEIQKARIEKKSATRKRLAGMKPAERREARTAGERQFGNKAPEYHRLRISPEAFAALKKLEPTKAHKD